MVAAIGALMVKFKSIGFANVIGKTAKFKTQFGSMAKNVKPQIEGLTKAFGKFGAIVGGVLIGLIAASPRLQAEFEILTIRVEQFLRPFGDELAPNIRIVSDLINTLTGAFQGLPQPIQDAATFGLGFVISLGLAAGAIVALGLIISPFASILAGLAIVAGLLNLAFETNFLGIQDIVTEVVDNITLTLDKIVKTVGSLLTGDLEGFLTGLGDLFFGAMTSIVDFISFIPKAFLDVVDDLTGGLVTKVISAGGSLLEGFLTGIGGVVTKVISGGASLITTIFTGIGTVFDNLVGELVTNFISGGASLIEGFFTGIGNVINETANVLGSWAENVFTFLGTLVTDFATAGTKLMAAFFSAIGNAIDAGIAGIQKGLEDFFALFGGSLPERGPLVHMVPAGEELGQAYVMAVSSGIASQTNRTSRTLSIENVNIGMREEQLNTERSFFDGMSEGVRKSTSW